MKRIIFFATLLLAQVLALAGDWSKPLTTSTYANFVTEVKARDTDLALGFDPAYTAATNISTNTIRWSSAARKWQVWSGTAWGDLATTYAISADSLNAANSYTVTGLTVSGGTANGVAYLNGSKVLTSGTSMTFNGSSLTVAGGGNNFNGYAFQTGNTNGLSIHNSGLTGNSAYYSAGGNVGLSLTGDYAVIGGASGHLYGVGGVEIGRLTSVGLGLKTTSPTSVVTIGTGTYSAAAAGTSGLYTQASGLVILSDGLSVASRTGGDKLTLDAAGNLGLGVTPSAWGSGIRALQIGTGLSPALSYVNGLDQTTNSYYDGTNWRYVLSGYAAGRYTINTSAFSTQHEWFIAAPGVAGNPITFTQAMLLDVAGTLTTTLNTATTATTQAQNDNSTKVATTAYADRAASETAAGRVELATVAEAVTGTDTVRAVTPAGVKAAIDGYGPTLMTAQATTSGTAFDFTGIPSWVKSITVMFSRVSTNGTSVPIIQIGSGSFVTTGYESSAMIAVGSSMQTASFTTGFAVTQTTASMASFSMSGAMVLTRISGNTWVSSGKFGLYANSASFTGGDITLGGALDRLRITTVNGTDAFDLGSVNVMYE